MVCVILIERSERSGSWGSSHIYNKKNVYMWPHIYNTRTTYIYIFKTDKLFTIYMCVYRASACLTIDLSISNHFLASPMIHHKFLKDKTVTRIYFLDTKF